MNTLMTFKRPKNAKGFTLIELMIAIAIVVIPYIRSEMKNSKETS